MKNTDMRESKISFLKKLESHVRRIKRNIKNTRNIISSSRRIQRAQMYMDKALEFDIESTLENCLKTIIANLQNAERELAKSKQDIHSKGVGAIRKDIGEVLEMAISRI